MPRLEIHVDPPMGVNDFYAAMMQANRQPEWLDEWGKPDSWIIGIDRMPDLAGIETMTGPLLLPRWVEGRQDGESILGVPVEWSSRTERLGKASLILGRPRTLTAYPSPQHRYQADPRFRDLVRRFVCLITEEEYAPVELIEAVKFVGERLDRASPKPPRREPEYLLINNDPDGTKASLAREIILSTASSPDPEGPSDSSTTRAPTPAGTPRRA